MGIGNLNNDFGRSTVGGVNKTNNVKNTGKAEETLNKEISTGSLKTATLSDKEGVKFDSYNMTDKTETLYAPKGKGKTGKKSWWRRLLDSFKDGINEWGKAHGLTSGNNKQFTKEELSKCEGVYGGWYQF